MVNSLNRQKQLIMKTKILLLLLTALGQFACQNQDWDFPDFDYTATYFPFQYPVRTLVLGDYVYDNQNDNNLKFLISPRISGMYENNQDWTVKFEVNEQLAHNLLTPKGDTIRILPPAYYQLSPQNQIVIPKGEFSAGIEVQLTEAFLNDTLAVGFNYVIPLMITSTTTDSLLTGVPAKPDADPRVAGDWVQMPKHFTLFGIKYVNPYHGKYLHRGASVIKNPEGETLETVVYRTRDVEKNEIWSLQTFRRNEVVVTGTLRTSAGSPGTFSLKLTFADNGTCTIAQARGSQFAASGSGKFVEDGDEWGNKKRDAIHLNYQINDGTNLHFITDTLVFRDKGVTFE